MTIPLMPEPIGFKYFVNDSTFNPINASVETWKASGTVQGNSIPWLLCIVCVVFLLQIMVYIRTESPSISAFPMLLMLLFLDYYAAVPQMFQPWLYGIAFIDLVLCFAFEVGPKIQKQD